MSRSTLEPATYEPAPGDADAETHGARLKRCLQCRECITGECQQTGTLVSIMARTHELCPLELWPGQTPSAPDPRREIARRVPRSQVTAAVDVIIPCHNYGRFLGEAIESAKRQTLPPARIVVVVDRSTDDSVDVARAAGVEVIEVDFGDVLQARRAGFEATSSPFVVFLDADDVLPPRYLETGIQQFGYTTGIVNSDFEYFGNRTGRRELRHDPRYGEQVNRIHAGAIARRAALDATAALEQEVADQSHGDWATWRKVIAGGWGVAHNPTPYRYRQHGNSMMDRNREERQGPGGYFRAANIAHEDVTLWIPLSGRWHTLQPLLNFLDAQMWPHSQTRLVFQDCSGDPDFGYRLRDWMAWCDYGDVRHLRFDTGIRRGVADEDRHQLPIRMQVERAVARIFTQMKQEVRTEWVWIVEDDVIPPPDVCRRLLESADHDVATLSAPYRSRYHDGFCTFDMQRRPYRVPGQGVEPIGGSGFGCTILRKSILDAAVITHAAVTRDYDHNFFAWLRTHEGGRYRSLVDWRLECRHLEAVPVPDQR